MNLLAEDPLLNNHSGPMTSILQRQVSHLFRPNQIGLMAATIMTCAFFVGCNGDSSDDKDPPNVVERTTPTDDSDASAQAQKLFHDGKLDESLKATEEALAETPNDSILLSLLVQLHTQLNNQVQAAQAAERLAAANPDLRSAVLVQAFNWYVQLADFASAERVARAAIAADSQNANAHRLLAQLLCSQGRRLESREPLEQLIRLGAANPRELLGLVDLSNPYRLVSFDEFRKDSEVDLFQFGDARLAFSDNGQVEPALKDTRRVIQKFPDCIAPQVFEGKLLIESGRIRQYEQWMRDCPEQAKQHPGFWSASGTYLQLKGLHREAVRSYGQAILVNPTDRQALRGLAECLEKLNEVDRAKKVRKKLDALEQVFRIANQADAPTCEKVAALLQDLSRPLESTGWLMLAKQLDGTINQLGEQFANRLRTITQWEQSAPAEKRLDSQFQKLVGLKLEDWPLFETPDAKSITALDDSNSDPKIQFREVASDVVLPQENVVIPESAKHIPYLYQTTGSGIAVIDYDLDGRLDIYELIASGKPIQQDPTSSNRLLRCLDEFVKHVDVAVASGVDDPGFGQGVCVGDFNQDGLPDLIVGNFGKNRMFRNQGDGTFIDQGAGFSDSSWTSSIALADVNGDHLPDMIQVNYVDDPEAPTKECPMGSNCTPQQLHPAVDFVFECQKDGSFRRIKDKKLDAKPNYGLGLIVCDIDSKPGNDIFISNDGDWNHYWSQVASSSSNELAESATIRGCAVGRNGLSQACMGIATGDFNRDGKMDLHVTNFLDEPSNLYVQTASGMFSDEAVKYGLLDASMNSLGFGCQSRDFDNDGWLDLAVLNGHVFGDPNGKVPFRMPPQIFRGHNKGFWLQSGGEFPYFSTDSLGRSLATADMNRDGKMDLLASHLDRGIAVLHNTTEQTGDWIQFRLYGTKSERDAIGARVKVVSPNGDFYAWRTAGDGYLSTNDPTIHIGLGTMDRAIDVEVRWPSGLEQRFEGLPVNQRHLFVEGADTAIVD